jgi:phospholipid/cholesterol/gamma-HCH transport system substrate-binding protein
MAAKRTTEFTVGLFVAGGMALAIVAVVWLGMSRFLEKGSYYAAYFNESVQGLDRDSPVKYRGVAVGRVQSIEVAPDGKLIQVMLKIESGQKLDSETVAQLKVVGITGSMFIELDRRKKGEPDRSPPLNFPSKYPIVATMPSDISMLLQGIGDFMGQIKSLDLKGISDKLKQTLDSSNQVIADADMKNLSASLAVVLSKASTNLDRLQSTLGRIEKIAADNERQIKGSIEQLQQSLVNMNSLLAKSSALVSGSDAALVQLRPNLFSAVQNMEKVTEGLNHLLEQLGQQPSRLLYGQPPRLRQEEFEAERP